MSLRERAIREAEQVEAGDEAMAEQSAPDKRTTRAAGRRRNRGSLPAHLPQAQIYARQGLIDRSTLADWVGPAAFLLKPVRLSRSTPTW